MKIQKNSALLAKYSQLYEKNPRSRVFAPLAEVYRKLGMIDKSFNVLKKGIKLHPNYVLGHIILAQCYYDQKKFDLAYNSLMPYVDSNQDNLSLQRLYGQICLELQYFEEALNTYKYLLLLNPKDQDAQEKVKKIEDEYLESSSIDETEPKVDGIEKFLNDDDWVQVDFSEPDHNRRSTDVAAELKEKFAQVEPIERNLDDEYFLQDFDSEDESVVPETEEDTPIVTLTLVDLYCQQGHYEKALEYIDSFLANNPKDEVVLSKKNEVLEMMDAQEVLDSDHSNLLNVTENNSPEDSTKLELQNVLNSYLEKIKERARNYESTNH